MIGVATVLPSVFAPDGPGTTYKGGIPLVLLQDLVNASVLLVDRDTTVKRVGRQVELWSPEARKQATVLLQSLQTRGRLVSFRLPDDAKPILCDECQTLLRLVADQSSDVLVYGRDCGAHVAGVGGATEMIPVDGYPTSRFRDWVGETMSVRVAAGTLTKDDFERAHIAPLFRYAKRVTIYDRWVGNTLQDGGTIPHVKKSFADTIEWLLTLYASNGRMGIKRFQLVTGLDMAKINRSQVPPLVDALARFRNRMADAHGIPFEIELKAERDRAPLGPHAPDLPHARFLVTNQIAIQVERGFDLLEPSVAHAAGRTRAPIMIRDVTLSRLTERARVAVETEVGRLETLAQIGREEE